MKNTPLALLLIIAATLSTACSTGRGNTVDAVSNAATGPEVALTVRAASFEPIDNWRMIEAPNTPEGVVYVSGDPILTETDIVSASVIDDPHGEPSLRLDFRDEGARRLFDHSSANLNKPVAFFIDHELISVPTITDPMSRSAVVHGSLEPFEAQRIADALTR
ncbi:MAG: hypothetical protein V3V20_02170 [Algisphaera sp.]